MCLKYMGVFHGSPWNYDIATNLVLGGKNGTKTLIKQFFDGMITLDCIPCNRVSIVEQQANLS